MREPRSGNDTSRLALRELRAAPCLAAADLLALDLARVARHEAGGPERLAQRLVELKQRARDAVVDRAGLAGDAAAVDRDLDVEAGRHRHELERLADDHAAGLAAEELLDRASVDRDLAGPRREVDAGGRTLATSGPVVGASSH